MQVESGIQLFSRLMQRPRLESLQPKIIPPDLKLTSKIIEVTGSFATGKSLLCMDMLARCVLPKSCENFELPGSGCMAVIINCDHHFDMFRFVAILEYYLSCNGKKFSCDVKKNVIESCLKKLFILNCYSYAQFQATLLNLDNILLRNPELCLIVIDSISAYYWSQRFDTCCSYVSYFNQILVILEGLVQRFEICVVFTKPEIEKQDNLRQVDYRIFLRKEGDSCIAEGLNLIDHSSSTYCYNIGKTINF